MNGDTHLAEDVTQTVFADLAKLAPTLSSDVMLGGWLHRHACFVAGKILRGAKPSEFPIQRPIYLSFLINMRTAKLLQLTIPPSLSALADEVIE